MGMTIETQKQVTIYSEDIERLEVEQIAAPTRDANITMPGYLPIAIMQQKCVSKPQDSGKRITLEVWSYSKVNAEACITFIRHCEERCFSDISLYLRSRLFGTDKIRTYEEYEKAVLHRLDFDKSLAATRSENRKKRLAEEADPDILCPVCYYHHTPIHQGGCHLD